MGRRLWRRRGRAEVVAAALLICATVLILGLLIFLPEDLSSIGSGKR